MIIKFYKYHGTGNDFILIDNRNKDINLTERHIKFLCDRHFGIGADGLMLLENDDSLDFKMRYFNSDGKEGTMCGNGGRCIVAFAKKLNIIENKTVFKAVDGAHEAEIRGADDVSLKMIDVDVENISNELEEYFLNTGSPHHVKFINADIDNIDVYNEGRKIRYSNKYAPEGTNVNFVQRIDTGIIKVRTYERGVENETLSCGTGVTASAIATFLYNGNNHREFKVLTKGGTLFVSFDYDKKFKNVYLSGPATYVFSGEIDIDYMPIYYCQQ